MKQILTLILTLVSSIGYSQKDLKSKLENYMNAQAAINSFGGTVLVTKNNSVLLKKAYGLADYEWNIKNTIDTKFQLASVTKQFTATAILQLVEKGKLSLKDPLSKFFRITQKPIVLPFTCYYLILPDLLLGFKELATSTINSDVAYAEIKKMPYEFSPGTKSAYSKYRLLFTSQNYYKKFQVSSTKIF
jgi:uncharacterized membrane protein (DUF2068 family)